MDRHQCGVGIRRIVRCTHGDRLRSSDAALEPSGHPRFCGGVGEFFETRALCPGAVAGGITGATLVWLHYLPHWQETLIPGLSWPATPLLRNPQPSQQCAQRNCWDIRAGVCGGGDLLPRRWRRLAFPPGSDPTWWLVSCGDRALARGPTGYAINPARDLGRASRTRYFPLQVRAHQIGAMR